MTEQRHDPTKDPEAHPDEPGAYVGRRPERQAETIPGGVRRDDERIAAVDSSRGPVKEDEDTADRREAGQDR